MRRAVIGLMLVAMLVAACGDDDGNDQPSGAESSASEDTGSDTGNDAAAQEEYLIVDGGEKELFIDSCVDTSGTYKGQLPNGGLMQLRIGNAPDESIVDYLPEADADPLSSQTGEDTVVTSDDGFTTGTSTVYTEDGANSLSLEFGIVIEDVEQGC
jgi:hypothetical protein